MHHDITKYFWPTLSNHSHILFVELSELLLALPPACFSLLTFCPLHASLTLLVTSQLHIQQANLGS